VSFLDEEIFGFIPSIFSEKGGKPVGIKPKVCSKGELFVCSITYTRKRGTDVGSVKINVS